MIELKSSIGMLTVEYLAQVTAVHHNAGALVSFPSIQCGWKTGGWYIVSV
jgi:hypothetical protein